MKLFRQWLFKRLAAFSLLLLVATLVIWIRSEFTCDRCIKLLLDPPSGFVGTAGEITWDEGRFMVIGHRPLNSTQTWDESPLWWRHRTTGDYGLNIHGPQNNDFGDVKFVWISHRKIPGPFGDWFEYRFVVRFWILALLFSIAPSLWIRCVTRPRRLPGQCRGCGYDLRATPERCPECGMIPKRKELVSN
jgi:hypothetical protein